jgi:hypothetical protein
MAYDGILVHTDTWAASSTTTSAGQSDTADLVNALFSTLGELVNDMAPIFFLSSAQNLSTAIEEFGQGMNAALACVSVDLQVVSSGLSSAAVAYAATDKDLARTFAQLDTQLGYFTHTAISANTLLPTPSIVQQTALNTAYQQAYNSDPSASNGFHLSQQQLKDLQTNNSQAAATAGVGVGVILLIVCICLI